MSLKIISVHTKIYFGTLVFESRKANPLMKRPSKNWTKLYVICYLIYSKKLLLVNKVVFNNTAMYAYAYLHYELFIGFLKS